MRLQQQNQTPMLAVNIKIFKFRFFFWKLVTFISQNRWTKRLFPCDRHPSPHTTSQLILRRFQALVSALKDLPQGARHALRTCLLEWEAGRLPARHLVDFVRSIAWQSRALSSLKPTWDLAASTTACQLLSAQEMLVGPFPVAYFSPVSQHSKQARSAPPPSVSPHFTNPRRRHC